MWGGGGGGGGGVSGRVRALNLTVPLGSGRVGSDDLGYGPGSASVLSPCRTLNYSLHFFKCDLSVQILFRATTYECPQYSSRKHSRIISNWKFMFTELMSNSLIIQLIINDRVRKFLS